MDDDLRALERAASAGDPDADARLGHALRRAGRDPRLDLVNVLARARDKRLLTLPFNVCPCGGELTVEGDHARIMCWPNEEPPFPPILVAFIADPARSREDQRRWVRSAQAFVASRGWHGGPPLVIVGSPPPAWIDAMIPVPTGGYVPRGIVPSLSSSRYHPPVGPALY